MTVTGQNTLVAAGNREKSNQWVRIILCVMEWRSNMTREQKEQYVIELYKKGMTIREIAQRVHMSFGNIGRIIKRYNEQIERESRHLEKGGSNNNKPKSKRTQAIKLFSEGRNLTDVVIELDLPPEKARRILREYLEARNMYEVLQIYEEIKASDKYSFPSFVRLHRILSDLGMGEEQINKVLELAKHDQLEHLQWKVEYLSNEQDKLYAAISILSRQKEELEHMNQTLGSNNNIGPSNDGGIGIFWRHNTELDSFDDKQMSDRY